MAPPELVRAYTLRPGTRLADLGVDSLTRVELVGELEAYLGVGLDDPTAAALDRVQDLFDLTSAPAATSEERRLRSIHA